MHTFLTNLRSPDFWLSVVLVGIAINVLSGYIAKRFESGFSRTSRWWRSRSEERKRKFQLAVDRLKADPREEARIRHMEVGLRFTSLQCGLIALMLLVISARIEWKFVGAGMVLLGLIIFSLAMALQEKADGLAAKLMEAMRA